MKARGRNLTVVLFVLCASRAHALDKQASAHGGGVGGADRGMALSGALTLGAALYNPSYAARPDNTGLALMRYAAHVDGDLIGSCRRQVRAIVHGDVSLADGRGRRQ